MTITPSGVHGWKDRAKSSESYLVSTFFRDSETYYWDGAKWKWSDRGIPPKSKITHAPGVITYREADRQRIYAFVRGENGHLYIHYWDGFKWRWSDRGRPPGTIMVNYPGVITYREADKQRIYAFVKGLNNHLYVNYWDGSQWRWANQGTPPGANVHSVPEVITYKLSGKQWIHAFVKGSNKRLYSNYWNGSKWSWMDHGEL